MTFLYDESNKGHNSDLACLIHANREQLNNLITFGNGYRKVGKSRLNGI